MSQEKQQEGWVVEPSAQRDRVNPDVPIWRKQWKVLQRELSYYDESALREACIAVGRFIRCGQTHGRPEARMATERQLSQLMSQYCERFYGQEQLGAEGLPKSSRTEGKITSEIVKAWNQLKEQVTWTCDLFLIDTFTEYQVTTDTHAWHQVTTCTDWEQLWKPVETQVQELLNETETEEALAIEGGFQELDSELKALEERIELQHYLEYEVLLEEARALYRGSYSF